MMIGKVFQSSSKWAFSCSSTLLEPIKSYTPCKFLHTTRYVARVSTKFQTKLDNLGHTAKSREEVEEIGLVKYMKKYRQYAQFSYQDWRIPKGSVGVSISCTRELLHPKIDDDKANTGSLKERSKDKVSKKFRELQSNRAIKKKVKDFHRRRFPIEAHNIYIEAHNLLNTTNWTMSEKEDTEDRLHELVTERAYQGMIDGLNNKTIMWKFLESIEPPRVVRIGHVPLLEEDNLYAQVTVRFHTKQILAVYDRFGRLMYGSPDSPRNVLEHVCFERHLLDECGRWRIHGKLATDAYPKEAIRRTVAAIKSNREQTDAVEWEKAEEEIHPYKYYPEREDRIKELKKYQNINKSSAWWRKLRKRRVLKRMGYGLKRMRGRARALTDMKWERVKKLREIGRLPHPPKDIPRE